MKVKSQVKAGIEDPDWEPVIFRVLHITNTSVTR
jgi:hypothetical protein